MTIEARQGYELREKQAAEEQKMKIKNETRKEAMKAAKERGEIPKARRWQMIYFADARKMRNPPPVKEVWKALANLTEEQKSSYKEQSRKEFTEMKVALARYFPKREARGRLGRPGRPSNVPASNVPAIPRGRVSGEIAASGSRVGGALEATPFAFSGLESRGRVDELIQQPLSLNVDSYTVQTTQESLLGSGSYGCVFKGVCRRSGGAVAFKLFRDGEDGFHEECIYKHLSKDIYYHVPFAGHAPFADLLAISKGPSMSTNAIVLELMDSDLKTAMKSGHHFKKGEDVARLLCQVTGGLWYMHLKKIYHLDLKPSNVLVQHTSNRAVLADFSLSCKFGAAQDGQKYGSECYRAPELLTQPYRASAVTVGVDYFSLGCLWWEVVEAIAAPVERLFPEGDRDVQSYSLFRQAKVGFTVSYWYSRLMRMALIHSVHFDIVRQLLDIDPKRRCVDKGPLWFSAQLRQPMDRLLARDEEE